MQRRNDIITKQILNILQCVFNDVVIKGLSAAEHKRLEALEPEQRGKILRAMVEQAARQHGQRVHGKLPPEVRERLAAAAPEERGPILAELRQRSREHESASWAATWTWIGRRWSASRPCRPKSACKR